jgi:hypothetical protein
MCPQPAVCLPQVQQWGTVSSISLYGSSWAMGPDEFFLDSAGAPLLIITNWAVSFSGYGLQRVPRGEDRTYEYPPESWVLLSTNAAMV